MDDALTAAASGPLVTAEWLKEHIGDATVKVIDASWRMPGDGRALDAYRQGHIPGAVFLDIDAVADRSTDLPHMLPSPAMFSEWAGASGVSDEDVVVVYDDKGMFSAPRAWWTFRAMGHKIVRVLDGGLVAWKAAGGAIETETPAPVKADYDARPDLSLVANAAQVRKTLQDGGGLIVDARPSPRFSGAAPEPRPGLRSGAMPGAENIPFSEVTRDYGARLETVEALRSKLIGADGGRPIVTTCGSGVTAAVLALAYAAIGHENVAVYDGSWAEWGRESNDAALFPCTTDGR